MNLQAELVTLRLDSRRENKNRLKAISQSGLGIIDAGTDQKSSFEGQLQCTFAF
jgi:hypothetical protein